MPVLMYHEGVLNQGVKHPKCKKVYHKVVVIQWLCLLTISTLRKTELICISIHYWQRYRAEKGIKTSGRTHRIPIFRFAGWPRGFRAARCQKPLKKSQKVPKMTKFTLLFVSSSPKITWSTWKHKNEGSVTPPGHFGTQFVLGAASIVEISLNLSIFQLFWAYRAPWRTFFTS